MIWSRLFALLLALFCGLAVTASNAQFAEPEGAAGYTPKSLVTAKRHMVVAAHPLAAEAGLATLRKGGSAVDAAIATQMVLNVVEPQSSGIGGGAFLLVWDAAKRELKSYDGRETAPAEATPNLFIGADGRPMPWEKAAASGLSVGTPGLLAALKMAHDAYGKLPWSELFEPAIGLARKGFPVGQRLHQLLADTGPESFAPEARAYFFDALGQPLPIGHMLANPALAETLAMIARDGPRAFYEGEIAQAIVDAVRSDPRGPGLLSLEDLAGYRAKERAPICLLYRLYEVCGAGPPSSGGIAVGQVLGMLEPYDFSKAPLAADALHMIAEAEKLAFADRNYYVADSDFVAVPVAGLLNPAYLASRRKLIRREAKQDVRPGVPPELPQGSFGRDATHEKGGTSHISIVDAEGNAVSMSTSIESAFGARLMVRGFLLNNQLTDFSFLPGDQRGQPIANRVEPGKRPRSSMDPTIVFDDRRALAFVLGSPGGQMIIPFTLKALIALIDWRLDAQAVASLPNFGSTGGPFLLEPDSTLDELAGVLAKRGHQVERPSLTSGLHIIAITPDGLEGGADPRREGAALGD